MKRRSKQALQKENCERVASDGDPLVHIKVWLLGVSSMVWRRVLVPADCTLRGPVTPHIVMLSCLSRAIIARAWPMS